MRWDRFRHIPWVDTRAKFVAAIPKNGSLLDLGSSDGGTLNHFAELRPDLSLASSDIAGNPSAYPRGTDFKQANFDTDRLPWPDASFDAITCMHVVEHLVKPSHLIGECARLLKPGGRVYIETPHPKTVNMKSPVGAGTEHVTVNFFDDSTHIRPVPVGELSKDALSAGLSVVSSGASRNLLFASSFPLLFLLRPRSRARYVAQIHFVGWSAFIVGRRP
jgi:SAM-dependent methyltransferase